MLCNNRTSGGFIIHDFKLYYRGIWKLISWFWHKKEVDQCNWIKGPEVNLHICGHLIFHKVAKSIWSSNTRNLKHFYNIHPEMFSHLIVNMLRLLNLSTIQFSFSCWWLIFATNTFDLENMRIDFHVLLKGCYA